MLHRHTCRHALLLLLPTVYKQTREYQTGEDAGCRRVRFDPIRVRINPIPSFPFDDGFLIRATTMIFARVSIELAHPLIYLMLEIELRAFQKSVIFALFLNHNENAYPCSRFELLKSGRRDLFEIIP